MERWDTLWDGGWTFCFDDGAFKPSTDSFLLGSFPPLRRGWRAAIWAPARGCWACCFWRGSRPSPSRGWSCPPPPALWRTAPPQPTA